MVASNIKAEHSFFWNKLFSFSGIFPAGAFLAEHFWANSYALVSIDKYDETSRGLQQIPWPVPIEFLFIWLPILFHGGYGVYVWWRGDRKSTRLNSSHGYISYAVFCLKKKKIKIRRHTFRSARVYL